jgi:hypothetical protein
MTRKKYSRDTYHDTDEYSSSSEEEELEELSEDEIYAIIENHMCALDDGDMRWVKDFINPSDMFRYLYVSDEFGNPSEYIAVDDNRMVFDLYVWIRNLVNVLRIEDDIVDTVMFSMLKTRASYMYVKPGTRSRFGLKC